MEVRPRENLPGTQPPILAFRGIQSCRALLGDGRGIYGEWGEGKQTASLFYKQNTCGPEGRRDLPKATERHPLFPMEKGISPLGLERMAYDMA